MFNSIKQTVKTNYDEIASLIEDYPKTAVISSIAASVVGARVGIYIRENYVAPNK